MKFTKYQITCKNTVRNKKASCSLACQYYVICIKFYNIKNNPIDFYGHILMLKTLKPCTVILNTKFNSNYYRKSRKRKCRMGLVLVPDNLQLHEKCFIWNQRQKWQFLMLADVCLLYSNMHFCMFKVYLTEVLCLYNRDR